MENSYLVQRLDRPYVGKIETPIQAISAYGLAATGLSQKAKEVLRQICVFDYMGSSEFEFGAIPAALKVVIINLDKYACETVEVDYQFKDWYSKKKKKKGVVSLLREEELVTGKAKVYIIAPKDDIAEIIVRIKYWALNSYNDQNHHTKEMVNLNVALGGSEHYERLSGWFELDNGFFFFKDETMFNNFKSLLGVS